MRSMFQAAAPVGVREPAPATMHTVPVDKDTLSPASKKCLNGFFEMSKNSELLLNGDLKCTANQPTHRGYAAA